MKILKPFVNLGPGDSIRAEMEDRGWSQKDLAAILGLSEKHINQLLSNKASVTIETARLLSGVFLQSPEFWMNLDAAYRLRATASEVPEVPGLLARLFEAMPIRDMQKKGWLPKDTALLKEHALAFWGITDIKDLSLLEAQKQQVCFRHSQKFEQYNYFYALTWLQKVKSLLGREPSPPAFSRIALQNLAERIHLFSRENQGITSFLAALNDAGVYFIVVPHLEKTFTDGASLWFEDHPAIVLTGRFNRNDNFWFTIAHEIGHVLLHEVELKENRPFIDSTEGEDQEQKKQEAEADAFARKHLKIDDTLRYFELRLRISEKAVAECARILALHPALIVGALQHAGRISYRLLNRHKQPVESFLTPYLRGCQEQLSRAHPQK